ncbi:MAG: substrate-binding domain-containing protein [Spirochaetia bacterium]
MLKNRGLKTVVLWLVVALMTISMAAFAAPAGKKRVYYYVGNFTGHPYFYDMHLGFKYAAQKFGCEIIKMGPDGWDPKAQSEALEQAISKKPDGIVTVMYDASPRPAVKRAMQAGIPVVVVEANVEDNGALAYIGLDNYQAGVDTAKELIKQAGTTGNVVCQGNWGASNTDAKVKGFEDYIKSHSKWQIVGRVDDKANTEASIEAAKSAFNNYKNMNAIVGLDSSSGPGIGAAMEELKINPEKVTVICHDREDTALEYIKKGFIKASLINKTASSAYQAILMLEAWNDDNIGIKLVPISRNNIKAKVNALPELQYLGTAIINKDNVDEFMHQNIPQFDTKLFH